MKIIAIVFIPIIGAFLLPLIGKVSKHLRNYLALIFISSSFILSATMIPRAMSGEAPLVFSTPFILGFNFTLTADSLAVFMACASSFIGAIIVLYSIGYIEHYNNQNEYYSMVVLFLGSMMGLVYSSNLIFLYVFWEITGFASWRLIGFFRDRKIIERADKAFLVTVFGALAMLIGFMMVYQQTGSFDLSEIKSVLTGHQISLIAIILILFGILSKSATLPFHTWLPDAGVAPSPVTALLHAAVLVKIGVYVFARLFIASFGSPEMCNTIALIVAAVSAIVSAGAALIDTDLKRIIAYSTISQIAFIFLGLASGTSIGIAGGLLYILMHGFAKAGLFLCAGIIEQRTHTKDITQLGGLFKSMPVTAISFLLCAFSVMGIPPFGGFFSKYLVFAGAIDGRHYYIGIVFLIGAFFTVLYLLRVFNCIFFGTSKFEGIREGSFLMILSVALMAIFSLLGGILINYPAHFASLVANQILGIVK